MAIQATIFDFPSPVFIWVNNPLFLGDNNIKKIEAN